MVNTLQELANVLAWIQTGCAVDGTPVHQVSSHSVLARRHRSFTGKTVTYLQWSMRLLWRHVLPHRM